MACRDYLYVWYTPVIDHTKIHCHEHIQKSQSSLYLTICTRRSELHMFLDRYLLMASEDIISYPTDDGERKASLRSVAAQNKVLKILNYFKLHLQ